MSDGERGGAVFFPLQDETAAAAQGLFFENGQAGAGKLCGRAAVCCVLSIRLTPSPSPLSVQVAFEPSLKKKKKKKVVLADGEEEGVEGATEGMGDLEGE